MKKLSNYLLLFVGIFLLVSATNPLNAQIFTQPDTLNLGITTTVGMFGEAWGDYDGDGYMDLFQAGAGNPSVLYRNDGGTQFIDVSATGVLVDSTGTSAEGPVWADFDNDGDLDLLCLDGGVKLYRNDGTVFTDISAASGLSAIDAGGASLWAPAVGDYDKDGDLDIALAGTDQGAGGTALPTRILNNAGGVFTNVADAVIGFDLTLESWNPAWVDVDNDGDLDLFMPTIRTPNEGCALLLNDNGELLITDRTQTGLTAKSAIYSAWADYNNDGYMDLYLVPFSGDADGGAKLFKNNGDGTFENVAPALGIDSTYSNCRAIAWGDYNNDGWIDLLVTQRNGLPQHLWRNEGGTFVRELDAGLPNGTQIRHAQFVDYDNDGFLDLYLGNMSAVKYLMHNNGNSNHWLGIKPVGVTTNKSGIGALIRVVTGSLAQIRNIQGGGGGSMSNGYLWGQFGLGSATVADSVIVKWSDGSIDVATNVAADQYYTFEQARGITGGPSGMINPDGGFEEATLGPKFGTDIPGWNLMLGGTATADFEVVDYDVKEGSHSLYVEVTGLGSNAWDIQVVNDPFTVQPNTQYTYTIWARADKEGSIVNFTVGSPSYTEWGRAHQQVITADWQQFTLTFTTPADADTGRAPIHLGEAANNPLLPVGYYFDDLRIVSTTGVDTKKSTTPIEYSLSQNYPNPFNPTTTIEFNLAHRANVRLEVVSVMGEVVKVIANGSYAAGNHQVQLDASDMATGIYFYRLTANGYVDVKKLVLMK